MSSMQDLLEGRIDFHGQKTADDAVRWALVASTALSFVLGFAMQSLKVTFGTLGLAVVGLCLLVLPPWPMFNQHPVQWAPTQEDKKTH